MANKPLKSLTFPDLADTYTIPTKVSDLTNDAGYVSSESMATDYSTSATYAVGDYIWYSGQLYRCTTAITTAESWTAAHWTAVKLAEDVGELKSALEAKIGFEKSITKNTFNNISGEIPSSTLAETRRWFFDHLFSAGETVTKIDFQSNRLTQQTLSFEVWTKSGDTLSKVKTVQIDVNQKQVYTVEINYTGASQYMIALNQTGHAVCYTSGTGLFVLTSTNVTESTDSLTYSSLSTAFTGFMPCINIVSFVDVKDNVVLVGYAQEYQEIQDALDGITDDSASNPYTILLLPKKTPYAPFSMLRDFSEPYPWSNISPRYISIIGVDKAHCVIRSDSGDYKKPCGELMTNGNVKNLTFIMTNDSQDPAATQGGYCLHIDCRTKDDVGYTMTIEDCDFSNASGPCLGIGMHKNCTLTIRRCNFKTTLAANYAPHEGYTSLKNFGVVFCHSSTLADSTNQRLAFEDCFGVCAEGARSLWLATAGDYDPSTASFYYRLLRNVFWNETQNAPAYDIASTLTAEPYNFGNNIPSA